MREQWENLTALRGPLLAWYARHGRDLPWRRDPTPYRTWVSEIMLQQTRVAAVLPYYHRFLAALPTVADLAAVEEGRLLKLWEGLGYYSRARNLRRAAGIVTEEYGGALPDSVDRLKKLPGIGDYTAAAIASIHFGVPAPAVDGNLLRVAARIALCAEDITDPAVKRRFRQLLAESIDRENPGKWNQAMMDLGATICLPNGEPDCGHCPAAPFCAAAANGLTGALPVRGEKKKRRAEERTVFLLIQDGKIALTQRPDNGLLAGLTEYPNVSGNLDEAAARIQLSRWGLSIEDLVPCGSAKHIFTHLEWQLKGWTARVRGDAPGLRWADREAFEAAAIPAAFRHFTAQARRLLEKNDTFE